MKKILSEDHSKNWTKEKKIVTGLKKIENDTLKLRS